MILLAAGLQNITVVGHFRPTTEYQRLAPRLRGAGLAGVLSTRVLILRVLGWR